MNDLCADPIGSGASRGRILAWLGEGHREVSWALCHLDRERWARVPAPHLGAWPALRHVRHLVLNGRHITLPSVQYALGAEPVEPVSTAALEQADAAWDPIAAAETADELVSELGSLRFDLLQRLEAAPDSAWAQPIPQASATDTPSRLDELLLRSRQHELEHLATIWKIALYWDRVSPPNERHAPAGSAGLPLHPADRLEESH